MKTFPSFSLTAIFLVSSVVGCASVPEETKIERVTEDIRIGGIEADEGLMRQMRELEVSQARQAGGALGYRRLGPLTINSVSANFSAVPERGRAGGRLVHNHLSSNSDQLNVDQFNEEWDGSLEFEQPLGLDRIRARVGGNFRSDESLPYGQVVWEPRFSNRTRGRFELYLNEISEDSADFRAIGAKHRLSVELMVNVTATEWATMRLSGHQYHTRDYDFLAEGLSAELVAASVLSRSSPVLVVRAFGSWQKNHLADSLPSGLMPSVLPVGTPVSSVIAPDYRVLGAGALVRTGQAESRPQAYVDGWAGAFWPDQQFAFQLRVGASTPVAGADVLALEAFYTNVARAQPGQDYHGVQLRYERLF